MSGPAGAQSPSGQSHHRSRILAVMHAVNLIPRVGLALLVLFGLASVPVAAVTLSERVTDETGVLTDAQIEQAQDAIDALDADGVQLWALFVSTTGGQSITDYADATAAENGLGGNDAVLVVAVDDRRDALWVGDLLDTVTDEEIDRILAEDVEPLLGAGEWGAAIAGAADGLGEAAASAVGEEPAASQAGAPAPAGEGSGGGLNLGVLLAVGALAAGAWMLWQRWRAGRAADEQDRERERSLRGLAQRANAMLIGTDELLRHNSQELGFVEAEFGADAAKPFRAALDAARNELKAAFRLRQLLDDGTPDAPADRERMLNEIVGHCEKANGLVEEQTARFQELRDLERRAPEVLAAQETQVAETRAEVPAVEALLGALRDEAGGSSQAVHGNVAEANKRLDLAERAASEGRQALERGERGAAGRAAKASQDALAQARALLAAVQHEAGALDEARTALSPALERARQDLEQAASAVAAESASDQRDELAAARSRLEAADAASRGTPRDLVMAYRLAREAEAAAESVIASVAEAREREAHELAAADAAIRSGELATARAEEYIASRRHGIGRRARTALSEADAALTRALSARDTDPRSALSHARRASELADAAYATAVRDFEATTDDGFGGTIVIGGAPFSTGRRSNWGNDAGGVIIGSIIGSILSGGGRRGGGGFGGFGGGGLGGFGGGGFGGGGFGGGGRSFGGGFGGGGGRSRGGGW